MAKELTSGLKNMENKMDEIKGQEIIEVSAPVMCLMDETKFYIPLPYAVILVRELQEKIDKIKKPTEY